MICDKILKILALPKTKIIGSLKRVYNPYTLFIPFDCKENFEYLFVTHLTEYQKNRIELRVPFTKEEETICSFLDSKKQVFALSSVATSGMTIIPDETTKLITEKLIKEYPFGTIFVPKDAIITPSAKEENIIIKEFDKCKSEQFAEVFGQPKKVMN